MIGTLTVNGMVLSAMPMGEYDKRLTILTVERGKISVFARGARKPNSSLLACSQPFSYGEFTAYAGRDSYTVTNAQISNYFPGLRKDLERTYLGMYFCEFADYYTREGNDEREVLRLLYQSLRALESRKFPPVLVRRVFELKLVSIEGEAPQVFECACCRHKKARSCAGAVQGAPAFNNAAADAAAPDGADGSRAGLTYFSPERDGMLCAACAADFASRGQCGILVSPACLYAMQYVVSTPSVQLYRFSLTKEVLAEFAALVQQYIKKHVGREMKTMQVLEIMGLEEK